MTSDSQHPKSGRELAWLSLGALGVVYGDIGTSPLYAMAECLSIAGDKPHAIRPEGYIPNEPLPAETLHYTPDAVYGILSLFFWALMLSALLDRSTSW